MTRLARFLVALANREFEILAKHLGLPCSDLCPIYGWIDPDSIWNLGKAAALDSSRAGGARNPHLRLSKLRFLRSGVTRSAFVSDALPRFLSSKVDPTPSPTCTEVDAGARARTRSPAS